MQKHLAIIRDSHTDKKMHEKYIQQLLTTFPTDPFHGPARSIMSGFDDLLASKESTEKLHLEFVKNRVTFHNTSFCESFHKTSFFQKEWYNLQRGDKEGSA